MVRLDGSFHVVRIRIRSEPSPTMITYLFGSGSSSIASGVGGVGLGVMAAFRIAIWGVSMKTQPCRRMCDAAPPN
eukprot:8366922-Alexandrium_andersonii.AAC.1